MIIVIPPRRRKGELIPYESDIFPDTYEKIELPMIMMFDARLKAAVLLRGSTELPIKERVAG